MGRIRKADERIGGAKIPQGAKVAEVHTFSRAANLPWLQRNTGVATADCPCRHVLRDHTACCDYAALVERDAGADEGIGSDPDLVLHDDGFHDQVKRGSQPVVVPCAEDGTLRDTDVVPDGDLLQIHEPRILAKPRVLTHRQLPGKCDLAARLCDYTP